MGYFRLDRLAAQFLFQLVSRRYQKTSIILTSNKSYGDWGAVLADPVLASAILDRLLHFSTTVAIRGQSYRLRDKRKADVFHDLTAPDPSPQKEARPATRTRDLGSFGLALLRRFALALTRGTPRDLSNGSCPAAGGSVAWGRGGPARAHAPTTAHRRARVAGRGRVPGAPPHFRQGGPAHSGRGCSPPPPVGPAAGGA